MSDMSFSGWKFEGEDWRGKVWSMVIGDLEYILFYTKDRCLRGGDFHTNKQYNVVLQGAIWFTKRNEFGIEEAMLLREGKAIVTDGGIPHYMMSIGESWVLEWHELPKDRTIYEPYRKLVIKSRDD